MGNLGFFDKTNLEQTTDNQCINLILLPAGSACGGLLVV
jgi:hypothetical protein